MLEIKPKKLKSYVEIKVAGSKSYTHRAIIAGALSNGIAKLTGFLESEDTHWTILGLQELGILIQKDDENLIIYGNNGSFKPSQNEIYLGNSGTSMRFFCGLASLGKGKYILNGTPRMQNRPVKELLLALNSIGIKATSKNNNDCPPIEIIACKPNKNLVSINCSKSSQYLSALLLIAPIFENGLEIQVEGEMVSKPYIDMTLKIMENFGISYERTAYDFFKINGSQTYKHCNLQIEPDASNASYFWIAGLIANIKVKVLNLDKTSVQGDLKLLNVFSKMGAKVLYEKDGIVVFKEGELNGIEVDMADMPDMVIGLSVLACFAKGRTVIKNISHLTIKESNRIEATAFELLKLGVSVQWTNNQIEILGKTIKNGAVIKTYDDHRIAMSFATIGLVCKGIFIEDENCVNKSFPNFWKTFEGLYERNS